MSEHCDHLREDEYWACTQPERPKDEHTLYHGGCKLCLRIMQIHSQMHGVSRGSYTLHLDAEQIGYAGPTMNINGVDYDPFPPLSEISVRSTLCRP